MIKINRRLQSKLAIDEKLDSDVYSQFSKIADYLFNYCHIEKGKEIRYDFLEVEFYYYSENHPDIITYRRKTNVGDWWFHDSGVDLCFPSTYRKGDNDKAYKDQTGHSFGGILIRSLIKTDKGNSVYITGPKKCCYDMFDQFSAITENGALDDFPHLVIDEKSRMLTLESCPRYFSFAKEVLLNSQKKLDSLIEANWDGVPAIDENQFKKFIVESRYRFFDKKRFESENIKTKNAYYVDLPLK